MINPVRIRRVDAFKDRCREVAAAQGWQPQFMGTEAGETSPQLQRHLSRFVAGNSDRLVFAVGGDGTVRACVHALAYSGVPLAIVPRGTANLFAHALGLPSKLGQALAVGFGGSERQVDLAVADGSPFVAMAGIGLDAAVVRSTPRLLKDHLGWVGYGVGALAHLRSPTKEMTVRLDGGDLLVRRAQSVVVGNVGILPGGFALLPGASLDDGLLDVGILAPKGLLGWASVARWVVAGKHHPGRQFEHYTARHVEVSTQADLPRELDGDVITPGRSLMVNVWHRALLVRAPEAHGTSFDRLKRPRRRRWNTRQANAVALNAWPTWVSQGTAHKEAAMPAVTVEDILVLPRIPTPGPGGAQGRRVRSVTTAPSGLEGEGFPVKRAFAGVPLSELDPFVHMDQMGEVDYGPGEPKGTPWHPHRGFETVTYIIDGTFVHQDSNGGGGRITDGDTQWMTAGAGILHIEAPPESLVVSGGLFHGIQLWVNLPSANKWEHPRYQDIRGREETLLTTEDGGALVRVIAGDVAGHQGPGSTFTPITLAHATLSPTAEMKLPWRPDFNALVYFLAGDGYAGEQLTPVRSGQLVVFGPGDYLQVGAARSQDSASLNVEVLVLGGLPIRAPVVHYGPFVMNTKDEIAQAMQDYQAGRLGKIPAEAMPHRHPSDVELPGSPATA